MKEFDIESIGKKMPYNTPTEEFFESITTQTVNMALKDERRRITLRRVAIGITSMAAAVIGAVVMLSPMMSSPTYEVELAQLDRDLDQYFNNLSYEEVSAIAEQSSIDCINYIN